MIGLAGINHTTAPVELRERFFFSEFDIRTFADLLRSNEPNSQLVVLSTCNRTEVYFDFGRACEQQDLKLVISRFLELKQVENACARDAFYSLRGNDAVQHLFKVAAGLDSMVLGENQILNQVKEAYRFSAAQKLTFTILDRLFHQAFAVGKRVRSETGINEGTSSVSFAAVELAGKIFGDLSKHSVLLAGAGETGELVLQSLRQRGCSHIHVTNRTFSRAQEVSALYKAEAVEIERLTELLLHCDIVIVSTASTTPIFTRRQLIPIMKMRKNRPLFFIDLSVPRNVEEGARKPEEVFVYDIDDLEAVVAHNRKLRAAEIASAERIIAEAEKEFDDWLESLNLSPTIQKLKTRIGEVSELELKKLRNRLPPEIYERIASYANFVEGKYLGMIVKNLKKLPRTESALTISTWSTSYSNCRC